jgi:hypothetical protein
MKMSKHTKKLSGAVDLINEINKRMEGSVQMVKSQLDLAENLAATREKMVKSALEDNIKQKNDLVETREYMSLKIEDLRTSIQKLIKENGNKIQYNSEKINELFQSNHLNQDIINSIR